MRNRRGRIPINCRHDYQLSQLNQNYNRFRIVPIIIALIAVAYLLQYKFAPGIEKETSYFYYYVILFYAVAIISVLFRIALPYLHEKAPLVSKEAIYFTYATILLLFCVCLAILDLAVSKDYTAYAVGVLGIAFIIRTSVTKYMMLIFGALVLVTLYSIFIIDIDNYFSLFLPIVVLSALGAFIAFTSGRSRQELFVLQFELEEKNEELRNISFKDALTNLYNRRYLMESLANQISYFKRTRIPLSIMMIDIDHFKKINDQLGHPTGDQALKELSSILQNSARGSDIPARFGGEEFIIVSTNTAKEGAFVLAERIRKTVEKHDFTEISWPVTLSIGISEARADDDENSLIDRTDKRLYKAKNSGRNRCIS